MARWRGRGCGLGPPHSRRRRGTRQAWNLCNKRGCAPIAWRAIRASNRNRPRGTTVAESHSRRRSWATVAAFSFILVVAIADGVDDGFSVWDWLIIAAGVVFIIQALFRL